MKNNIFIIIILTFFFNLLSSDVIASEEFKFESKSIELLNSSKTIIAKDGVKITSNDGINISALISNYNKTSKF